MDTHSGTSIKTNNDPTPLSEVRLNITDKTRSNLFPWRGQFSPQLIEAILAEYAPDDSFVFDPFVGSGTVLLEAGRRRLRAFGTELNPAAEKLAQVYAFINRSKGERERTIRRVLSELEPALDMPTPMFGGNESNAPWDSVVRDALDGCADSDALRLLHAFVIALDLHKASAVRERLNVVWERLISTIRSLPHSPEPISIANCDARQTPLPDGVVDIVVTSPPYINVFNYHQQYRKSAEFLGCDVLKIARSEIGANRKFRGNRFLTVVQYCLDLSQCLTEMKRVCRDDAQIIMVLGRESNVRKTRFLNSDIVKRLAENDGGLDLRLEQSRVFTNRFGKRIYEDLLHFYVADRLSTSQPDGARQIGISALKDALPHAPDESRKDLLQAIDDGIGVASSPMHVQPNSKE